MRESDQNSVEQVIDDAAAEWVNGVVPGIYKMLDRAGILYSEDLLCESLTDGFKAGAVWGIGMAKDRTQP